ncbi:MAG TPA: cytochrome c biogenesis protein CcdA [Acidimicrobiales bacterium]|nr:cytochrome c biogenesis protein CcdA [Acidimicrobiales bacterium]
MGAGVSYIVAFGGGVASFVSPCVLPVVPGYLSMITGVDVATGDRVAGPNLWRIARETGLFIVGFGTVFVLLGLVTTEAGDALLRNKRILTEISGAVVLAMAAFLLATLVLRSAPFVREARFHPSSSKLSRLGPLTALVAGAAFGFGWTPCIGPVLSAVLATAASGRSVSEASALLVAYTLGLGVPFLAVGCAFGRLAGALRFARRHAQQIVLASALVLAGFGVLLVLDRLTWLTSQLETAMSAIGLGFFVHHVG